MNRPIVAITMGDPAGVGPEVVVKALARPEVYERCRPLVVGDARRLRAAVEITGAGLAVAPVDGPEDAAYERGTVDVVDLDCVPDDLPFGELSPVAGEAAYRFIATAVELATSGRVGAICTAPLNKEALHAAGHAYPGHTELLAELTGTEEVSMMLNAPKLRVIHVTTHLGIIDMVERIEPGLVERTIRRGHDTLVKAGIEHPRIAVCGINPHAGENGLFGYGEEEKKVAPGIAAARAAGIDAQGPLPKTGTEHPRIAGCATNPHAGENGLFGYGGEGKKAAPAIAAARAAAIAARGPPPAATIFSPAARGASNLVAPMYHNQGHG